MSGKQLFTYSNIIVHDFYHTGLQYSDSYNINTKKKYPFEFEKGIFII